MIRVEAKGEVEALKDTINQMIANLKETTLTKPGTGLVEIEPCEVYPDAAGPKRPEYGNTTYPFGTCPGGKCATGYVLYPGTG